MKHSMIGKIAAMGMLALCSWAFGQTFPVQNLQVNGSSAFVGPITATGLITNADLATQAGNTVLGNGTGVTASPSPLMMPSCTSSGTALQWQAGVGFRCSSIMSSVITVTTYGAVGDSNGTTGNGTDNTTAFQNAFNASANQSLFIPCGTYRLTGTVSVLDGQPRFIYGNGTCTKIFNDSATAVSTFNFNPTSGTCSSAQLLPCLIFRDMVFITPTVATGNQSALFLKNTNSPLITGVTFTGQNAGIVLTATFDPKILFNQFISGSTGVFSQDQSANAGEIGSNGFYGMSGDAINISPSSGCAVGVGIHNNDMEANAGSILLGGVCGAHVTQNYIENVAGQAALIFTGTNNSVFVSGNAINSASGTLTIQNVTNIQFVDNFISNTTFAVGGSARQVRLRKSENNLSTVTIPTSSVASCGGLGAGGTCAIGTGSDDFSGYVTLNTGTGPASSGSVTLNFSNPQGPNNVTCVWTPVSVTGSWVTPTLALTSLAATASSVTWFNGAALTASAVYFLAYKCEGY